MGVTDVRVMVEMGTEAAAAVLPADLRAQLAELAEPTGCLALADILITGWGSSVVLDESILDGAPRLSAVVHAAGSVKGVVTPAVWDRGIVVSSAADANAGPVADYTVAAVALAAKKALSTAAGYATGRPGCWPGFGDRRGADGQIVGVVGASRIGRRVIARLLASAARFRVLLYDPHVSTAEAALLGVELVGLNTLCGASTIVTLHAPELPETRWLLNAERLALIPDGGTVINTARGSLIDTDALTLECASGRLDAFLDVTDPEPLPPGHRLPTLGNVLVTPHIAGAQGSEARRLGAYAVGEVGRLVRGEPLLGLVSREDLRRLA